MCFLTQTFEKRGLHRNKTILKYVFVNITFLENLQSILKNIFTDDLKEFFLQISCLNIKYFMKKNILESLVNTNSVVYQSVEHTN